MRRLLCLLLLWLVSGPVAAVPIGGPFTLTNQDGKQVRDTDFRGRYVLLFFGFTRCVDVCPATASVMAETLKALKADAIPVAGLFVTVDPQHDRPAELKAFLHRFSGPIVGLTGTPQQIVALEKEYRTWSTQLKGSQETGFDHSVYIYLMDPDGRYLTVFTLDSSPRRIAARIRAEAAKRRGHRE